MAEPNDTVPGRIQAQPPILGGLTAFELVSAIGVSVMVAIPVIGIFVGLGVSIGSAMGILFFCVVAVVFALTQLAPRWKRGRPEGFFRIALLKFLQKLGLGKFFVEAEGAMMCRRSIRR
jgi:conjugative transfer region protein (TIGR03750 family)